MGIALTEYWWITRYDEHGPVREALLKAHAHTWMQVVTAALTDNEEVDSQPANWKALSRLMLRDYGNLFKKKEGKSPVTQEEFLAIATLLRIPVGQLFPSNAEWIAQATCVLCGEEPVKFIDKARAYAIYRTACPCMPGDAHLGAGHLDERAVAKVLQEMVVFQNNRRKVEEVIRSVAQEIDKHLCA